jgi:hypothetical protein
MKTVARRATRNDLGDGGLGLLGWSVEIQSGMPRLTSCGSVFFREHHCEDARRDRGIGGIRRRQLHVCVVIVDLPKAADVAILDETEVVLAVRIVVFVKVIERANSRKNQTTRPRGRLGARGLK